MPRTTLVKTTPLGAYGDYAAVNVADAVLAAADVANKNQFSAGGKDLIVALNSGVTPHTVTITSAPDTFGRTKDIAAYSLGAGELGVFGPMELLGWAQSDGKIYLEADHAEIKFAVIAIP